MDIGRGDGRPTIPSGSGRGGDVMLRNPVEEEEEEDDDRGIDEPLGSTALETGDTSACSG